MDKKERRLRRRSFACYTFLMETEQIQIPSQSRYGLGATLLVVVVLLLLLGMSMFYISQQGKQVEPVVTSAIENPQQNDFESLKQMYLEKYKYTTPSVCNENNERCLFFHNSFGLLSSRSLYYQNEEYKQPLVEPTLEDYTVLSETCGTELFASSTIAKAIKTSFVQPWFTSDNLVEQAQKNVCYDLLHNYTYLVVTSSSSAWHIPINDLDGLKDNIYVTGERGISYVSFDGKDIVWAESWSVMCSSSEQSYRLRWNQATESYPLKAEKEQFTQTISEC